MKKGNTSPKSVTPNQGKDTKASDSAQFIERQREELILEAWANANVYPGATKKTDVAVRTKANVAGVPAASVPDTGSYVLREMPTQIHALTLNTLCRKICQDIFLKAEIMQGHQVTYVPAWETYPACIEEQVIAEAKSKAPINLPGFRKRCRLLHKQKLATQKQKFHQLGIFADWDSAQKTLEARQEAKLIGLISRLREYSYLHDLPQLSPWCPQCSAPLNAGKVEQIPAEVLHGYVKFPFKVGLEEFGVDVFFCGQLPRIWEIAGTMALGITEDSTYWLTQFEDEYLIFAEPQLKNFQKHLLKGEARPKRIRKVKCAELTQCTVSHPLFLPKELDIIAVPESVVSRAAATLEKLGLKTPPIGKNEALSGIIHLNPAHHPLSYHIARALDINSTAIFDETGKFTEEAGALCGLNLFAAEKFIVHELERFGYLLKTQQEELHQPHCHRCKELSVFRPCSQWVFSISENPTTRKLINAPEYWDNYGDTAHKDIGDVQKAVSDFTDLQVSAQRQWGMPLPILICDECDEPLTDKSTLRAIRNSIRRGFEFWFRLSVEELLPAETRCPNCNSNEFRKEATLIESHFANLLQIIDNSDFKKAPGGATSVAFVPQTGFSEWLSEISVISAALSRSRPIKESQPFKQLKLSSMPKTDSTYKIEDTFLNKYPADVLRLVAITPVDSGLECTSHLGAEGKNPLQSRGLVPFSRKTTLETLAERYLTEYRQLQILLQDMNALLYGFLLDVQNGDVLGLETPSTTDLEQMEDDFDLFPDESHWEEQEHDVWVSNPSHTQEGIAGQPLLFNPNLEDLGAGTAGDVTTDKKLLMDSLAIAVTNQLLQKVQHAYENRNFHEMWKLLMDFCEADLRFYVDAIGARPTATLHSAQSTLLMISTVLLQRLAPLTPFLAEHFYTLIFTDGAAETHSIFQKSWNQLQPTQFHNVGAAPASPVLAQWETLKNEYQSKA